MFDHSLKFFFFFGLLRFSLGIDHRKASIHSYEMNRVRVQWWSSLPDHATADAECLLAGRLRDYRSNGWCAVDGKDVLKSMTWNPHKVLAPL